MSRKQTQKLFGRDVPKGEHIMSASEFLAYAEKNPYFNSKYGMMSIGGKIVIYAYGDETLDTSPVEKEGYSHASKLMNRWAPQPAPCV